MVSYFLMLLSAITRILHKDGVGVEDCAGDGEYRGVIVGIGIFVPPAAGVELAEADKVDAAAAFGEEFTAPFGKHLGLVEAYFAFWRVEHVRRARRRDSCVCARS